MRQSAMGAIYTRLVKCLYKKYTIRKGIDYNKADDFVKVLKSVGKLALRTLKLNNPLLKRSEGVSEVGEFAFDLWTFCWTWGSLECCTWPHSADLYVTYPHRSLEEFLGSVGCILTLDDDTLTSDTEEPIFMTNPLVLSFCLWFLSSSDLDLVPTDKYCNMLATYCAKRIDSELLDTEKIEYNYQTLVPAKDDLKTNFLRKVFQKCEHITTVRFQDSYAIDRLNLIEIIDIPTLTYIFVGNDIFQLRTTEKKSLTLSIDVTHSEGVEVANLLLDRYKLLQKNPRIFLKIALTGRQDTCDITPLLSRNVTVLHIEHPVFSRDQLNFIFTASGEFPKCPMLTHLIIKHYMDDVLCTKLNDAIQKDFSPFLDL